MGIEFGLDVVTNKIQGERVHKSLEFYESHYSQDGILALSRKLDWASLYPCFITWDTAC